MTIIKNHFEVFLVTSKKQGNGIIESKVGLYSIRPVHTYLSVKCQLWPRFRVGNSTVVNQNKIGQSVTLDSFTIQRFV
jgi:hypothetical protein